MKHKKLTAKKPKIYAFLAFNTRKKQHTISTVNISQRLESLHTRKHEQSQVQAKLPPKPPVVINEIYACNPQTPLQELWNIAQQYPFLRKWIVANPNANAELLEYIAQVSGPGVEQALQVLCESIDELGKT